MIYYQILYILALRSLCRLGQLGKILKVGLCKLHLVINEYGEIQKVVFTAGNVD